MARLEFAGARYVRNYHLAVPHHELVIDGKKSLSKKPSLEDNLIIHGDNLKALKSLLPHFAGKVKCVYIDPPYNTGNEHWKYNDNVSSPRHKIWRELKEVDKEVLDRHDIWLSMMMPRLKLLRQLLREDGLILVSIDDNEQAELGLLMNEIFGEENFICQFVWQKAAGSQNDNNFVAVAHEYVLLYGKDKARARLFNLPPSAEMLKTYKLSDEFEATRGKHTLRALNDFSIGDRPGLHYDIKCPDGTVLKGNEHRWRCDSKRFARRLSEKRIVFEKRSEGWEVFYKKYINEQKEKIEIDAQGNVLSYGKIAQSLLLDLAFTGDGKREMRAIFGNPEIFPYPKPSLLISHLLTICTKNSDVILDSFAGSGTTAHAVLTLNRADGGNRRFILVEQEDYADKITAERVRRVIKGLKTAKDESLREALIGSFSYVALGEEYDVGKILSGKTLPKYEDMAAYVFQTATGETLDRKKIDKKKHYIGSSKFYDVYLFYEPDVDRLKSAECALNLDFVESLPMNPKKKRLIFGAVRYVNQETLTAHDVEFSQLPYEVYRRVEEA